MTEVVDRVRYVVVRNAEEQYSIWPEPDEPPAGWQVTGFIGARDACLAHIDEVWTDMRPLSLRRALAEAGSRTAVDVAADQDPVPDLVSRLCEGEHRVAVVLRPEPSLDRLRVALERRYLHLRFPDTGGGTELGLELTEDTNVATADLEVGSGELRIVGDLTLDFERLRCRAVVAVTELTGHATLRRR